MSRRRGRAGVVTGANLSPMTDTSGVPRPATTDRSPNLPGHLEQWREATRGTLIERTGMELTHVERDRVTATMPVAGNTQPAGLLHGGATVALAETVGSIAAQVHAGPGRAAVGIEVGATHHRGVRAGHVHAVATPLHLGRTTASYEIVVTDDEGRRVCTARLTCMVLDRG